MKKFWVQLKQNEYSGRQKKQILKRKEKKKWKRKTDVYPMKSMNEVTQII